jgi:hypothetical protein
MTLTATPLADLYSACDRVDLVDVPEQLTVHLDGSGPLDGPEFAAAARLLYGVSHAVHYLAKGVFGHAPAVMPLEALWTPEPVSPGWRWRAFIVQPHPIDENLIAEVLGRARRVDSPLGRVTVSRWHEGLAAQVLADGGLTGMPAVVGLHVGIEGLGYRRRGPHHEIYLGDPRRTRPEQRHTILRQPIEAA